MNCGSPQEQERWHIRAELLQFRRDITKDYLKQNTPKSPEARRYKLK